MQRVAIARALVHEPRLLVCDEPTAALDHETGLTVMELLREAAVRPDRAVVVVTHDNRVFGFGDRIAHMDDGAIVRVDDRSRGRRSNGKPSGIRHLVDTLNQEASMFTKIVLPILAVAGVFFAINRVVEARRPEPVAQPIVEPPTRPDAVKMIAGSGLVEARRENIPIGVNIPGVVTEVFVKKGQKVKAGDPLFRTDDREFKSMLAVREAELAAAKAQLHKLIVSPRPEDIPPAKAAAQEAEARMDDAEAALARTERLFQRQMIAASDYDKDRYAFYAAKATYAKAKADLEKILAGSWKEDIEIARAAVQLAQSQVESIKINLERLIVRAPMDGEVLQLNVRLGQFAAMTWKEPMIVLGDSKRLHVRVDIDEPELLYFSKSTPAIATLKGRPNVRFHSEVRLCRALRHPQAELDRQQLRAGRSARAAGASTNCPRNGRWTSISASRWTST